MKPFSSLPSIFAQPKYSYVHYYQIENRIALWSLESVKGWQQGQKILLFYFIWTWKKSIIIFFNCYIHRRTKVFSNFVHSSWLLAFVVQSWSAYLLISSWHLVVFYEAVLHSTSFLCPMVVHFSWQIRSTVSVILIFFLRIHLLIFLSSSSAHRIRLSIVRSWILFRIFQEGSCIECLCFQCIRYYWTENFSVG